MQSEIFERIAQWSVGLEISGTAVQSVEEAERVHIADSLAGLEIPVLRTAQSVVDIGSGAGFPGLVLAAALPQAHVVLVDSVRKKMEAAAAFAGEIGLGNVECIWARVEQLSALGSAHREVHDVVTARALAPLPVLLEYAAPLLRKGGALVAWKGALRDEELVAAGSAADELGFSEVDVIEATPYEGSHSRRFCVCVKLQQTSDRFPRRPGVARKRQLGATKR